MCYFVFCDERLPEEPYASRYEIIVRACFFLNGKLYEKPAFWISYARYEGEGYWQEYVTDHPNEIDGHGNRDLYLLPSSGMDSLQIDEDPDIFGLEEDADLVAAYDVVGYYPLAEIPDLTALKPMDYK